MKFDKKSDEKYFAAVGFLTTPGTYEVKKWTIHHGFYDGILASTIHTQFTFFLLACEHHHLSAAGAERAPVSVTTEDLDYRRQSCYHHHHDDLHAPHPQRVGSSRERHRRAGAAAAAACGKCCDTSCSAR